MDHELFFLIKFII